MCSMIGTKVVSLIDAEAEVSLSGVGPKGVPIDEKDVIHLKKGEVGEIIERELDGWSVEFENDRLLSSLYIRKIFFLLREEFEIIGVEK